MTSSGFWLSANQVSNASLSAQKTLNNDMVAQAEAEARQLVNDSKKPFWERPWGLRKNLNYPATRELFVAEFSEALHTSYHYNNILRIKVAADAAINMVEDGKMFMSIEDFSFINKYFMEV